MPSLKLILLVNGEPEALPTQFEKMLEEALGSGPLGFEFKVALDCETKGVGESDKIVLEAQSLLQEFKALDHRRRDLQRRARRELDRHRIPVDSTHRVTGAFMSAFFEQAISAIRTHFHLFGMKAANPDVFEEHLRTFRKSKSP